MQTHWLSELWRYRELLYFLAWRDVKVRYKQAVLGGMWAVLQPLLAMIVFTLFFGKLAGIPSDGIPYPLFSFCALVPWMYFSSTLSQAGNSLITNRNLITKVYFPRVLLPAATALGGLLDFLISSVFLAFMMLYYGVRPGLSLLLYPLFVFILVTLVIGVSMLLAALNVRYRDIKYAIPFLVQLWLFVTPIIYPSTFFPPQYQNLLAINPLCGLIEGFRACLFPGKTINLSIVGISLAVTVVLFSLGALYFHRTERAFADIV